MSEDDVTRLARELGRACLRRGVMLVAAESCTGGGVAEACTRISGSSAWFERGMVTYTNVSKEEMLGVSARTLESHGAVSEEVAREMAAGALARSRADVSVAVTGIAEQANETRSSESAAMRRRVTSSSCSSRTPIRGSISRIV